MLKPPPQQPTEIVSHDIDFRLPPPPVFEKGDDDLRTPMYNAPLTILDAPALSDLENLLVSFSYAKLLIFRLLFNKLLHRQWLKM